MNIVTHVVVCYVNICYRVFAESVSFMAGEYRQAWRGLLKTGGTVVEDI